MKNILYLLLMAFFVGCLSSCKDMTDIYQEYVVTGGYKYPQKADSLKVYAGFNKLRLTWLKSKDPSVVTARVYWNNYLDSMTINVSQIQDEIITVDVDDLGEGSYTFYVKTFDQHGNSSIVSEVSGTSYGDNYVMGLTDRTYSSALRDASLTGTIEWGVKTTDLVYTEIRYTTTSGAKTIVSVLPDQTVLKCPDIKPGEFFEYRSVFLPTNGIDIVERDWITSDKPFMYKYPRSTWTAVAKNGNHAWGDGGGGQTPLLFDGNTATGWHSTVGTSFPNCVVVDFKEPLVVDYLTIIPPGTVSWRYLKDIQIYLTNAPIDPNDSGLESILAALTPVAEGQYPGGDSYPMYLSAPVTGQYMTLLFPNSTSAYISFMELDVFGY